MKAEALLALFVKLLDERFASMPPPVAGPRGLRGPRGLEGERGADGQSFNFAEHELKIKEWAKEFALKFSDLSAEDVESLRGRPGRDGRDGHSFAFADHVDEIKAILEQQKLRFEDFTPEEIAALTGPRGAEGRGFIFEEHADQIRAWVTEQKLRFEDFTDDEIAQLRGPRGRDGRHGLNGADGRDFTFADHRDEISHILADVVAGLAPDLRLKFSDLTEEDKLSLRGPRGQRGKSGKDFDFAEHEDFFRSLKPKFQDFSADERESLKLHFRDLTDVERDTLRLKFENLTDDERLMIRGPRGQRGKAGRDGVDGERGERGQSIRGLPGPMGLRGLPGVHGVDGRNGQDGADGADAPRIVDVSIVQRRGEYAFVFTFDDGSEVRTNFISMPAAQVYVAGGGIVSSGSNGVGSGGNGADGKSAYQIWLDQGNTGTVSDFLNSLVGQKGDTGPEGGTGPQGDPGVPGNDGRDGVDGLNGIDGAPGTNGADGAPGPQGDPGVAGAQGPKGDQGDTGAQGVKGDTGAQGVKGDTGAQGVKGDTGAQGVKGDTGAQGVKGDTGAIGPDGKSAYQIWLDAGNTGTQSDFIASLKGDKGDKGDPGTTGAGSVADTYQIISDIPCSTDVYVSSCVRMSESDFVEDHMADWTTLGGVTAIKSGTYTSKAVNASAATYHESNVIGIVVKKPTPATCNIRIAGIASGIFYGLDVAEEYYLSDKDPGRIVTSAAAPQDDNHVFLKIGQPTGFDSLLFLRGDRLVRSATAEPEP